MLLLKNKMYSIFLSALKDERSHINALNTDGQSALHFALDEGNYRCASLLVDAGIDVNLYGENASPPVFQMLLFDEPSLGLAPLMVERIFEVITEINREKNIAILLSEQDVYKALAMSNRAYILETGKMVLDGTSEDIINNDMVKKAYLGL